MDSIHLKTEGKSSGQGLVEYALILLLVVLIVIVVLALLGPPVANMYSETLNSF